MAVKHERNNNKYAGIQENRGSIEDTSMYETPRRDMKPKPRNIFKETQEEKRSSSGRTNNTRMKTEAEEEQIEEPRMSEIPRRIKMIVPRTIFKEPQEKLRNNYGKTHNRRKKKEEVRKGGSEEEVGTAIDEHREQINTNEHRNQTEDEARTIRNEYERSQETNLILTRIPHRGNT